ncbi:MAG: hypothetical protein GY805_08945, partial [Chloroflexi bacterium]|nr:hypothetical protein [Chloroflexota bacterium]
ANKASTSCNNNDHSDLLLILNTVIIPINFNIPTKLKPPAGSLNEHAQDLNLREVAHPVASKIRTLKFCGYHLGSDIYDILGLMRDNTTNYLDLIGFQKTYQVLI